MTKIDELKSWLRDRGTVVKHEVMEWGVKNYSTRAARNVRNLCKGEDAIVKRLSSFEKIMQGFVDRDGKAIIQAVYQYKEVQPRLL